MRQTVASGGPLHEAESASVGERAGAVTLGVDAFVG